MAQYPKCPGGRYGNRAIQTPGADWRNMNRRGGKDPRSMVHNPPDPNEGEKPGFVSTVARYFQRYVGAGKAGKQATSSYLRPKKVTEKRLKAALGED